MAKWLVNAHSEQSAGWYSDDVARVLLGQINGWSVADAPDETTSADPEPSGPVWLINNDDAGTLAEYPGPIAFVLLKQGNGWAETDLRPPPPPVEDAPLEAPTGTESADNPNTGESADEPKE